MARELRLFAATFANEVGKEKRAKTKDKGENTMLFKSHRKALDAGLNVPQP